MTSLVFSDILLLIVQPTSVSLPGVGWIFFCAFFDILKNSLFQGGFLKYPTLLRYPGGKSRAVSLLSTYPVGDKFASPFFGGGSFELSLLRSGKQVFASDVFRCLVNFWENVSSNGEEVAQLCAPLLGNVSKEVFRSLQECLVSAEQYPSVTEALGDVVVKNVLENFFAVASPVSLASCFFVVNRCSFSGATLSGGFSASSSAQRFTDSAVKRVATWGCPSRFSIECASFEDFLPRFASPDFTWFLDPPYLLEKESLYGVRGGYHSGFDHGALAGLVRDFADSGGGFILTYNDCGAIRELYSGFEFRIPTWAYGMNSSKKSNEVVVSNIHP